MSNVNVPRILVTGASGRLGQTAVETLLAGGFPVVAGSRDPSKLVSGAAVRRVDFDDEASLPEAFAGIERVLLISTDKFAEPGRRVKQHRAAVQAAAAAGVSHIAYTSMMNPGPESPIPFAGDHRATEQAILDTGLTFTFLRNSFYQENLAISLPAIQSGTLHTAAGLGRASYVSIADCARSAAGAIAKGIPGIFDVTGPASLTIEDLMAVMSQVLGRDVAVKHLSEADLLEHLRRLGLPEGMPELLVSFDRTTRLNLAAQVTDSVQVLSGRDPEPVIDVLSRPPFAAA